jgi:hypothetical protein
MKPTQADSTFSARTATGIAVFAALIMLLHAFALRYTPDDALISFRYALNIAHGNGPVFNIGQHVEGYTSRLWVFTLGALRSIGLPIESTALILSLGATVLAVLLLPSLSRRLGYSFWGLDALLLAANTSFAVWAGASMEMPVFAFFLVLAALAFVSEKRPWLNGMLFATLALVRPEGIIFGGLGVVFALRPVIKREPNALKNWIVFFLIFVAPVVAHLLWRLSYYGYPLPNTFYVKTGFTLAQAWRGATYLGGRGCWTVSRSTIPAVIAWFDHSPRWQAVLRRSWTRYVSRIRGCCRWRLDGEFPGYHARHALHRSLRRSGLATNWLEAESVLARPCVSHRSRLCRAGNPNFGFYAVVLD